MGIRTRVWDQLLKGMSLGHRGILAVSRGRIGWSVGSIFMVELHTIGRSTGARRSTMLSAPLHEPGRYVLVASKGGDDRHPQWYLNLVANPDVELTVKGVTQPMRARTADPAEKARLWPEIVAAYPNYARYQQKTSRDIPVVICEPRGALEPGERA
jgi:deazaflavin-dependent oxidoreductase (nitroreductase family)